MTTTRANHDFWRREPPSGGKDEPLRARAAQRNAQATRQRILAAAFAEFAAAGLAGARVDRIAASAGCNKSLIFVYFASKAALFEAVVGKELERIEREVGFGTGDAAQFAARLFDFAMGHPRSMRLLAWYGLETEADRQPERATPGSSRRLGLEPASPAERSARSFPTGFLPAAIVALSTAWSQGNPIGQLLASSGRGEPGQWRDAVLEGVRRLAE